jgi:hypothetical protein
MGDPVVDPAPTQLLTLLQRPRPSIWLSEHRTARRLLVRLRQAAAHGRRRVAADGPRRRCH